MVKRRTFKRSLKATVNKVMSKYARRKISYIFAIQWNNGNLYVDGEQKQTQVIGDCLTGNTGEYQTLGKQYAQVKLRGVSIESVCIGLTQGYNFGLCLGQANDVSTFDNVRTQPNVMLLGDNIKSKMYFPISGSFTSTNSIELFNNVKLIPFAQGTPNATFSIRVTMYLTFKSSV